MEREKKARKMNEGVEFENETGFKMKGVHEL